VFDSQQKQEMFPFSKVFRLWLWGPLIFQINGYTQYVYRVGYKAWGHIADCVLESSVEVKDMWIVSSIQSLM